MKALSALLERYINYTAENSVKNIYQFINVLYKVSDKLEF